MTAVPCNGCTQARLRELLIYDELTGSFVWRVSRSRGAKQGGIGGSKNKLSGYVQITVEGTRYWAHRIAWFYVYGTMPVEMIDHINGDKADNRIANLRLANHSENAQNKCAAHRNNQSGLLGVSWDGQRRKWAAYIQTGVQHEFLGRFDSKEEAHSAYLDAKVERHPFQAVGESP